MMKFDDNQWAGVTQDDRVFQRRKDKKIAPFIGATGGDGGIRTLDPGFAQMLP